MSETPRSSTTPSSTPPPPPLEALRPVVIPRLVPMSSESLMPPVVPPSDPPPRPEASAPSVPPPRPRGERRARPPRSAQPEAAAKDDDESDDRDVVDIRWVLAAAVLLAVVIGTWTLARRGEPQLSPAPNSERIPLRLSGVPRGARVTLDGRSVTGSELTVRGGVRHAVEVHVDGRETWRQVFITNGELELVVQPGAALAASGTAAAATVQADAGVAAGSAAPAPPAAPAPTPTPAEPAPEPRTVTATSGSERPSTSTTTSTSPPTTTRPPAMRASHTLVRDPGF